MTELEFWNLISRALDFTPYSPENHENLLRTELSMLTKEALYEFICIFNNKIGSLCTWKLWAVAWVIRDQDNSFGCGDSDFFDFRGGLVSHGKFVYETARNYPDDLALEPQIFDIRFQSGTLAYMGLVVYDELYSDLQVYPSSNEPPTPEGNKWSEDENQNMSYFINELPKCIEKWGLPRLHVAND